MPNSSWKRTISLIILVSLLISIPLSVYTVTTQRMLFQKKAMEELPTASRLLEQDYLRTHEPIVERDFQRSEIADKSVYFHQRMIDSVIVEKDFINYQFDKKTGRSLKKSSHWRPDLPAHFPQIKITQQQAESMATGKAQFSHLYIISPESDIFPIKPTPKNPCWVVTSKENSMMLLTIIDAVTGDQLGFGIPPPSQGFSLSGPIYFNPCSDVWTNWYLSAKNWFEMMGYPTEAIEWPAKEEIKRFIQDPKTSLFYEIAHGSSSNFQNRCAEGASGLSMEVEHVVLFTDIEEWMAGREKMPFSFIASCDGMCWIEDDTLSYEFRKGSSQDCATVGYCHMGFPECLNCWSYSLLWQTTMFNYLYNGDTVKTAFDKALTDYPLCGQPNDCLRFAGDDRFKIDLSRALTPTPTPTPLPSFSKIIKNYGTDDLKTDLNKDGLVNGLDFGQLLQLIKQKLSYLLKINS